MSYQANFPIVRPLLSVLGKQDCSQVQLFYGGHATTTTTSTTTPFDPRVAGCLDDRQQHCWGHPFVSPPCLSYFVSPPCYHVPCWLASPDLAWPGPSFLSWPAGDAVLFWSVTPDLVLDPHALHGACPVIKGEKWSAAKWIRDKPTSFSKFRKTSKKA